MNIKLDVPYSDKDEVKKYGVKWNNNYKTWYLQDYKNLPYVIDYLENKDFTIYATEKLHIIEGFIKCWKCFKIIPVYALGVSKASYIDYEDECWKFTSKFKMVYNISSYSQALENILKKLNINDIMKISYSNTIQSSYLMNLCQNCGAKQGEFFLFNEIDSVFSPTSVKEAKKLKIYEIPLLFDIGLDGEFVDIISSDCSDINALIWFNAERVDITP